MRNLYFALGIIALSFLVKVISNRTYIAPAGRDREIAPTVDAPSRSGDHSYGERTGRDLEIVR